LCKYTNIEIQGKSIDSLCSLYFESDINFSVNSLRLRKVKIEIEKGKSLKVLEGLFLEEGSLAFGVDIDESKISILKSFSNFELKDKEGKGLSLRVNEEKYSRSSIILNEIPEEIRMVDENTICISKKGRSISILVEKEFYRRIEISGNISGHFHIRITTFDPRYSLPINIKIEVEGEELGKNKVSHFFINIEALIIGECECEGVGNCRIRQYNFKQYKSFQITEEFIPPTISKQFLLEESHPTLFIDFYPSGSQTCDSQSQYDNGNLCYIDGENFSDSDFTQYFYHNFSLHGNIESSVLNINVHGIGFKFIQLKSYDDNVYSIQYQYNIQWAEFYDLTLDNILLNFFSGPYDNVTIHHLSLKNGGQFHGSAITNLQPYGYQISEVLNIYPTHEFFLNPPKNINLNVIKFCESSIDSISYSSQDKILITWSSGETTSLLPCIESYVTYYYYFNVLSSQITIDFPPSVELSFDIHLIFFSSCLIKGKAESSTHLFIHKNVKDISIEPNLLEFVSVTPRRLAIIFNGEIYETGWAPMQHHFIELFSDEIPYSTALSFTSNGQPIIFPNDPYDLTDEFLLISTVYIGPFSLNFDNFPENLQIEILNRDITSLIQYSLSISSKNFYFKKLTILLTLSISISNPFSLNVNELIVGFSDFSISNPDSFYYDKLQVGSIKTPLSYYASIISSPFFSNKPIESLILPSPCSINYLNGLLNFSDISLSVDATRISNIIFLGGNSGTSFISKISSSNSDNVIPNSFAYQILASHSLTDILIYLEAKISPSKPVTIISEKSIILNLINPHGHQINKEGDFQSTQYHGSSDGDAKFNVYPDRECRPKEHDSQSQFNCLGYGDIIMPIDNVFSYYFWFYPASSNPTSFKIDFTLFPPNITVNIYSFNYKQKLIVECPNTLKSLTLSNVLLDNSISYYLPSINDFVTHLYLFNNSGVSMWSSIDIRNLYVDDLSIINYVYIFFQLAPWDSLTIFIEGLDVIETKHNSPDFFNFIYRTKSSQIEFNRVKRIIFSISSISLTTIQINSDINMDPYMIEFNVHGPINFVTDQTSQGNIIINVTNNGFPITSSTVLTPLIFIKGQIHYFQYGGIGSPCLLDNNKYNLSTNELNIIHKSTENKYYLRVKSSPSNPCIEGFNLSQNPQSTCYFPASSNSSGFIWVSSSNNVSTHDIITITFETNSSINLGGIPWSCNIVIDGSSTVTFVNNASENITLYTSISIKCNVYNAIQEISSFIKVINNLIVFSPGYILPNLNGIDCFAILYVNASYLVSHPNNFALSYHHIYLSENINSFEINDRNFRINSFQSLSYFLPLTLEEFSFYFNISSDYRLTLSGSTSNILKLNFIISSYSVTDNYTFDLFNQINHTSSSNLIFNFNGGSNIGLVFDSIFHDYPIILSGGIYLVP
ncbi:MAG: hypothetical protein LBB45_05605, partial [Methanobrevibacter sp.]|nr:hypothetical protein [Candidatus Methanovirga basalitermitum]